MRRLKHAASTPHFGGGGIFGMLHARRETCMDAWQRSITTRRGFLHHGATLAGAAALPAAGAGALAATSNTKVRLA